MSRKLTSRQGRVTAILAVVSGLFVTAAGLRADDPAAENKGYRAWKNFPIGTHVTYQSSTQVGAEATVTRITHKLVGLTSEKAIVETSAVVTARGRERKQAPVSAEIPRTGKPEAETGPKPEKLDEGTESLTVAGRSFTARFTKTRVVTEGTTIETTAWTSDEVPGGLVKLVAKMTGRREGRTTMELVAVGK